MKRFLCVRVKTKLDLSQLKYHTGDIIPGSLYIYHPVFEVHFFVFKVFFSENSVLMYGWYSRAVSNQEWVMMARIWYVLGLY